MSSYGQAVAAIRPNRKLPKNNYSINKRKSMKLTLRQKLRNWLMNDETDDYPCSISVDESPSIDSNGFRLQVYKANGGVVVETRTYDRRKDENYNSLYVITEDKDLGEEIGKIITMENLRG